MGVHPTLRRTFPTKPTLRPAPILYCGVPSHTPCTAVYLPRALRRTLPHLFCGLPFSCTAMRVLYFILLQTLHCGLPPSCTAAYPPTPVLWPTPPLHCCDAILLYFFAVTLGRLCGPCRNAFPNDVIIIFYVTLGKCYGREFRCSKIEIIKFPNPRP